MNMLIPSYPEGVPVSEDIMPWKLLCNVGNQDLSPC